MCESSGRISRSTASRHAAGEPGREKITRPARTPAWARESIAADPILASVLQHRVQAISRDMATVLMRSSRSPIFNENGDLVTVIFDREGRTLAQTEYASIIANGAQPPLHRIIVYFGDDIHDGDVILHNDVFSGGNQNADAGEKPAPAACVRGTRCRRTALGGVETPMCRSPG